MERPSPNVEVDFDDLAIEARERLSAMARHAGDPVRLDRSLSRAPWGALLLGASVLALIGVLVARGSGLFDAHPAARSQASLAGKQRRADTSSASARRPSRYVTTPA